MRKNRKAEETRRWIVHYMRKHKKVTLSDLAVALGLEETYTGNHVRTMSKSSTIPITCYKGVVMYLPDN